LIFSGVLLLIIVIAVKHNYEKNRFIRKAKNILENYKGEIYFYKSDISSLPFYLQRCIPKLENPQTIKDGIVVTKRKYEKVFANCTKIIEAPEFNEYFILLRCNKN